MGQAIATWKRYGKGRGGKLDEREHLAAPDVERVLVFERLGKGEMAQKELAGQMRGVRTELKRQILSHGLDQFHLISRYMTPGLV